MINPATNLTAISAAQVAKGLHAQTQLATKINKPFDNMKGMSAMTFNFNKEMPSASSFATKVKPTNIADVIGNFKR
ncbi:hypothetical protein J7S35_000660 [Lactobacillus gasseri]|uniref:hypothetical protein n=1 Tax=Lactobacillus gasseri TaxID=1596 RepID=UPI001AE31049|nr:hypothetical protein [Lactobacillus gasseri]QTP20200.1 hypothetical protein J7S35_000660 [Lactobacillus gasseri]